MVLFLFDEKMYNKGIGFMNDKLESVYYWESEAIIWDIRVIKKQMK